MSVFDLPGLFTDANAAALRPTSFFWDRGYRWLVGQAQNGDKIKPLSLGADRAAGMRIGPWGVTYAKEDFARDGAALAKIANAMSADLMIMDAEECLKGADPTPLIDACATYTGPKGLSVLGAASGKNVYPIDILKFIAAGWHVLAQAYTATSTDYRPELCLEHWVGRAGVPLDRFHLTVDSSPEFRPTDVGGLGRAQSPEEILADLRQTRITSVDVSVFMAEYGDDHFYDTLKEITMRTEPTTPTDTRNAMLELGKAQESRWVKGGLSQATISSSRIGLADAVLSLSDSALHEKQAALRTALG